MDHQCTDRESGVRLTVSVGVVLALIGFVMAWPIYELCYYAMANVRGGWGALFFVLLPVTLAMRFGGAVLVGVGLFLPLKRPWLGAVAGLVVQILITLAIYFTDSPE